ncbi:1-phosphofructokinase family hexose kinase [Dactylosporangium fulvum]
MIVTVTLNPALDLTYTVDELVRHATHRVGVVAEHAGGKGLNVANVLHALGEPVLATGLLGGRTGTHVRALVDAAGLAGSFVTIGGETRRTVTVVDRADATGLWEPGPTVTSAEWAAFAEHYESLMAGASVVVLSGSLPQGLRPDTYAVLIAAAKRHGVRTVLDTSGEALVHGAAAAPDVVKPNAEEARAIGRTGTLVVSRGREGLIAYTGEGTFEAAAPEIVEGNPTGAGDACAAAIARGLRDGTPWPALLADAAALAAAAVAAPVAGAVDLDEYDRLRRRGPHVQPDR